MVLFLFLFLLCFYRCIEYFSILKKLKSPKRWLLIKQHEKKSSIKKWKILYSRQMQESFLFSNKETFSMANGSWKLCLCVSLWWKCWSLQSVCIGDHFQKCITHCQHVLLPSQEESHFLKWFNYANSGAIIIRYIKNLRQQKRIFFLKSELSVKMKIRNYKTFQVSFQFCSFVTNKRQFLK